MSIPFTKMSGSGNDFIIIDNRSALVDDASKQDFVRKVCTPKISIGADGVIFIENSDKADFRWDFYNADGSSAEMCGNGGRCVARYAFEKKIAPSKMTFETIAGIIHAEVSGHNVKVKLTTPKNLRRNVDVVLGGTTYSVDSINTGVPHAVIFSQDVDKEDVQNIGRGVRYHSVFAPAGTNVNLVQRKDAHSLKVRTYERGVEGETLACGTGVVASAILASCRNEMKSPVQIETRGGEILQVYFQAGNEAFTDVYLEGLTKTTFEGSIIEL